MPKDLTAKQEGFAQSIAYQGMNQSDAYRANYDCSNMADTTVWDNAYTLTNHTEVAPRIEELRQAIDSRIEDDVLMTRSEAFKEMGANRDGAMAVNQWGPAVSASKSRMDIAGIATEQVTIDTALGAVLKLAEGMNDAYLRGLAAGRGPVIEGKSHGL